MATQPAGGSHAGGQELGEILHDADCETARE
jgi:hypothetical protein